MGSVKGTPALPQCHGLFANRHNIALGRVSEFPYRLPNTPGTIDLSFGRGCALNTNDERRPRKGSLLSSCPATPKVQPRQQKAASSLVQRP